MAIKSFKRFEKKFILSQQQYNELVPRLLEYMNPDTHCKNDKNYTIYNIYYDTKNNDVIRHSISKPYYKEKLRLRSYTVPTSLDDKVFLELKKKINGIVSKRRVVMTLGEAYEFLYYGKKPIQDDYINKQVLEEIEYYLSKNKVYPAVYIGYTRNAYFGKDDTDFRLTFDSKIIARRYDLSLEDGCFGNDILGEERYLMEVKFLGAIPIWFTQILSELKIYNTNFSKYGNEYMSYCFENKNNSSKRREKIC
ncbi:VTC domain-containing protein [Romboutsia weinsteinii]|uniref:VTC domain-containing protein n=1 Tax=Romboutsia weinsteinii TaxID=2020949 RepID=A0A371J743_9FIRM|nr:polyphosphate polymerase domain-containing protein [Romboutsia weinsteinii]RDY28487.1 VTC domain-containing protein [Romboutsia weinsteinii]